MSPLAVMCPAVVISPVPSSTINLLVSTVIPPLSPKLVKVPSDVSYYNRDWEPVFKEWGSIDFGPRESEMYDWNSRANYQAATKEYHAHMAKVATKLNAGIKGLEGAGDKWRKIIEKHRKNDRKYPY
mgnify:CR=1 FL=1